MDFEESRAALDAERKHLEGLLKDRLNFFLVFASVFLLGSYRIMDPLVHRYTLFAGTLVSILMLLAVFRTHRLVQKALKRLEADENHPYTQLKKDLKFPWNANYSLLAIPVILTCLFLFLAFSPPEPESAEEPNILAPNSLGFSPAIDAR